ncbi:MAG: 3-methyl-2-oxobutanoate hydroxymethyltransferase [Nitrospinae bacterium]|nr:3-methyl-2-oxobutanoate hydroxymethyltransferase [Nitrospinota bacterium]
MTERKKVTVPRVVAKKAAGEKITMVTAYDYPAARLVDRAGVDIILVGDSLGMVVLGYEDTTKVTMDEMLHHSRAVARARPRALVVGDMPFGTFQASADDAVRNAVRFVQEGGAEAVKLEGGQAVASAAASIVAAGIPVMGHIGLTPQSIHALGGYRVQGRTSEAESRLLRDAASLEAAGVFAVVLEGMPLKLGRRITEALRVPTIGIGAGPHCDGQVLVLHDLLGFFDGFAPKFAKAYADLNTVIVEAVERFRAEVEAGAFPDREHSYE